MTGTLYARLWTRTIAAAALAATLVLALAATAFADTASLTFTDAAGQADPVARVERTLTLAGTVTAPTRLYVRVRAAGGAPCAASASSDPGSSVFPQFVGDVLDDTPVEGDFQRQRTGSWLTAGTYQFCIWLADSSEAITTPLTQTITFRPATATISATVTPATVGIDQPATVTVTGTAEAPMRVTGTARPAGTPCAASFMQDDGRTLFADRPVNGAFTFAVETRIETPGQWLVCLWVADSSAARTQVAGPQTATFTVAPPPAPCVVPVVVRGESPAQATGRLTAASCRVGTIHTVPSRAPRGSVFAFAPESGQKLVTNASVDLYVSDGPACVVPSIPRSRSVAATRTRLVAAGCTAGRVVKRTSSRYRRGRVIRLSKPTGKRLAPRATVDLVVSRGRR